MYIFNVVKALHIIFMVTWMSGLFYLPRLFVYHSMQENNSELSEQFKIMERRLYRGIVMPGGILTTVFGLWLVFLAWQAYQYRWWFYAKVVLVGFLWIYHFSCGYYLKQFKTGTNKHNHIFYRWFNEFPTIILIAVVLLVVIKP